MDKEEEEKKHYDVGDLIRYKSFYTCMIGIVVRIEFFKHDYDGNRYKHYAKWFDREGMILFVTNNDKANIELISKGYLEH